MELVSGGQSMLEPVDIIEENAKLSVACLSLSIV